MGSGKSPGLDAVQVEILKSLPASVLDPLAKAFSSVICYADPASCVLPPEWAVGVLRLIPKPKTLGTAPGDFRPICLLSTTFKLFESVILARVQRWTLLFDRQELAANRAPFIHPCQGGFRPGRSTVDQVAQLVLQQSFALKKGVPLFCAFLDIKKAFDSLPIHRTLCKMLSRGFPVQMLRVLDFLLCNHRV
jgi:hypothetical protein